ncbi:MAG: hypothetical protein J2P37_31280 [Ktedonobacteraceae bacterium]|nr:hypothetical protein [Ktedonobacteraceae bacterium]
MTSSKKQREHPLPNGPLPVVMEDDFQHTADFPVCGHPDCCCYQYERERMAQDTQRRQHPRRRIFLASPPTGLDAPLNGNRPFRLLR